MTSEDPSHPTRQNRLSRWSERKRLAQREPTAVAAEPAVAEEPPDTPLDSATTEVDEVVLSDADMPAIDTIDSDSDISCFFNKGVSEPLRQLALRQLFRSPVFNITDGLNDYDEDYTSFEPLGDIVTSDMRFHAERKARLAEQEAQLAEQADAESSLPDEPDNADAESEVATQDDTVHEVVEPDQAAVTSTPQDDEPSLLTEQADDEQIIATGSTESAPVDQTEETKTDNRNKQV